ncbi:cilia- and flagella-associated protein 61-like [Glossina fuscipes]|uniref:Cilia- and flagella-associated protein 61-like n=1 Tax=Glossina fuscipes TaxID=7396 RepID=A0A9C5Z508_9MUSC|nr:cilia- and flagella-associated protein 61-like [Glossina fuscipes]
MADFYDIKNASVEDFDEIVLFFFSPSIKFFGEPLGKQLSPQTYFSRYVSHRLLIRKIDATNAIVGYAELNNSPYMPALLEDCWMDWLTFHYCTRLPLSVTNTYFFNTFVYNDSHNPQMLKQIVEEFFFRENKIRFIITAEAPDCPSAYSAYSHGRPSFQCLEAVSHIFYPVCFSAITCPNTECIHVIYRDEMISTMRYRLALPEDNDDIVEIVHADRPELKESLGDFYIAEELLATSSKSLLIITEIHNITSGFVWLNEDLHFYTLLENFQLDMFGNLMKFDPKLRFREKGIRINVATTTAAHLLFTSEAIQNLYDSKSLDSLSLSLGSEGSTLYFSDQAEFLAKCQLLDQNLEDPDHYVKVQPVNHAFRYNMPDDVENFPYDGYPNAFSIQLFGLTEKHDPRRMYSFLSTAFVAFPDRDYCLLSVSVTISMTPVLFEVLKYFLRATPRPGCKIDEHLYITHRSAIYGDLSIVRLRPKDKQDILNLFAEPETVELVTRRTTTRSTFIASRVSMISNVQDMSKMTMSEDVRNQAAFDRKSVNAYLDHILENSCSSYQCFTIRCGNSTKPPDENSLIGFVIIKPFLYNISLHKHYILPKTDENVNLFNAELLALKLHPFFHNQADVIFRELARQTYYRQFYYFKPSRSMAVCNDLITNMQPVEPRRIKKVWFCNFMPPLANKHKFMSMFSVEDEDLDTPTIDYLNDSYSLFSNNLRPSIFFGNATNIVVIGFGDMCKALLRCLIFSKHMCTNNYLPSLNITVIANAGVVEAEYDFKFQCEFCENQDNCYINFNSADAFVRDVSDRLDTRLWVRFFGGTVSDINLIKRTVVLEKGCDVYYETLLLMCDTDFEMPEVLANYETRKPANYIQINSRFDKIMAYHKLRALQATPSDVKRKIVVYGAHIRTFEFINFLVTHGVAGKDVILISPYSKEGAQRRLVLNNCTVDVNIEHVLKEMVEDLGVQINDQMSLEEFELYSDNRTLKCVKFKGLHSDKTMEIECDLFVCFEDKFLSKETIEMLEMTGLAMDSGRVLVNNQFQTSDPFVYALGKFVKHTEPPNHQYLFVNPKEAVTKLMVYLGWNSEPKEVEEKFSMPAYFQAQLPMGYYMVKLVSPKRYLARHLSNEYGFRMTTYENREFARVRLTNLGYVEEIVVVTEKFQDFDFLKYFCGRHELLLNNLKARWYLKEITNFVDFFQEPWVELIMNDHFKKLQEYNKQLIKPAVEEVMSLNLSREQRFKVMQNYANDFGITARLEEAVLLFLQEHREEFHTEFALPQDFPNISEDTEPI